MLECCCSKKTAEHLWGVGLFLHPLWVSLLLHHLCHSPCEGHVGTTFLGQFFEKKLCKFYRFSKKLLQWIKQFCFSIELEISPEKNEMNSKSQDRCRPRMQGVEKVHRSVGTTVSNSIWPAPIFWPKTGV